MRSQVALLVVVLSYRRLIARRTKLAQALIKFIRRLLIGTTTPLLRKRVMFTLARGRITKYHRWHLASIMRTMGSRRVSLKVCVVTGNIVLRINILWSLLKSGTRLVILCLKSPSWYPLWILSRLRGQKRTIVIIWLGSTRRCLGKQLTRLLTMARRSVICLLCIVL